MYTCVYVCGCMCVHALIQHKCEGQRTAYMNEFSSTMWVPGIRFRAFCLAESTFACPKFSIFNVGFVLRSTENFLRNADFRVIWGPKHHYLYFVKLFKWWSDFHRQKKENVTKHMQKSMFHSEKEVFCCNGQRLWTLTCI